MWSEKDRCDDWTEYTSIAPQTGCGSTTCVPGYSPAFTTDEGNRILFLRKGLNPLKCLSFGCSELKNRF